jgi:autotransporter adhesin
MAETNSNLNTVLAKIGDFLGRKFKAIKTYVDEKMTEVKTYVDGQITEVKTYVDGQIDDVNANISKQISFLQKYFEEKINSLAKTVSEHTEKLRYFKHNSDQNSTTIGSATSTRKNEVSVGSEGAERIIANVMAGKKDTDAVNVAQMKKAIADLVNDAPETLDTLKELADALQENSSVVETIRELITEKYNELHIEVADYGTYEQFVNAFNDQVGEDSIFYEKIA